MSSTRRLVLAASLATSGLAATAHAQEAGGPPGACACVVPTAAAAAPAPRALPRWGVGLHMTSLGLAPDGAPEGTEPTKFGGGGFQVTYRVRPRLQLALSIDHLREQREDGTEGDRHLQSVTLAALWHPRPHARWDWYLLAGLGATGDGDPDLSDEEREATQQGHVHLGVGVERRFRRIGIAAELRMVGIAPREDDDAAEPAPAPGPAGTPMTVPAAEEERGLSGGQLTVAASYYF